MPTRVRQWGFTLLELLVVMFIIGIIAAMATLSVGVATSEKGTEKEVERIEDLLKLASEEAVLQGREFGLTFYAREYEFSSYDPGNARWTPIADDGGPFAPHRFPPDAVVDLEIEDRLVALKEQRPERRAEPKREEQEAEAQRNRIVGRRDEGLPQIFILSSGDIMPFELRVKPNIGSPAVSLQVADDGTVTRVRDER